MLEFILGLNIFKLTLIAIGIILFIFAIYLMVANLMKIIRCRKEVEAVVVNIDKEYRNGRIVYIPEIGYIANNIEYYKRLAPSNNFGIRQHLKVYVNEKNPNIFILNKNGLFFGICLSVFGAVLLYIGIFIL